MAMVMAIDDTAATAMEGAMAWCADGVDVLGLGATSP
jgi:hypothetical protein